MLFWWPFLLHRVKTIVSAVSQNPHLHVFLPSLFLSSSTSQLSLVQLRPGPTSQLLRSLLSTLERLVTQGAERLSPSTFSIPLLLSLYRQAFSDHPKYHGNLHPNSYAFLCIVPNPTESIYHYLMHSTFYLSVGCLSSPCQFSNVTPDTTVLINCLWKHEWVHMKLLSLSSGSNIVLLWGHSGSSREASWVILSLTTNK